MKILCHRQLWLSAILFGLIITSLTAGEIKIDYFGISSNGSKWFAMVTNNTLRPIAGFYTIGTYNNNRLILLYVAKDENLLPGQSCILMQTKRIPLDTQDTAILLAAVSVDEKKELSGEVERGKRREDPVFDVSKTAVVFAESTESSSGTPSQLHSLPLYKDVNSGTTYRALRSKFRLESSKDYLRFPFNHLIETVELGGNRVEFVFANPKTVVKCPNFENYRNDDENQLFEVGIRFPEMVSLSEVRKIADEKYGTAQDGTFSTESFPQWRRTEDNAPVIVRKIVQLQYPAYIYSSGGYSVYLYGGSTPNSVKILPLDSPFHETVFGLAAQYRLPLDWS